MKLISLLLSLALCTTAYAQTEGAKREIITAGGVNTLKSDLNSGGTIDSALITSAPLGDDFKLGSDDAPLIMIDYVSMSCPHCAHLTNAIMPEIEDKYVRTGKLLYIQRQFPLNEPAFKAAMLLSCVGTENAKRYHTFTKVMFDAQRNWAFDANYLEGLQTIARVGGISPEQFNACMNDTDKEIEILEKKKQAAEELQLPHTPYIVIGGEVFAGERSVEGISQFIDAKLAAKGAK